MVVFGRWIICWEMVFLIVEVVLSDGLIGFIGFGKR
jgi:hypothetical protein